MLGNQSTANVHYRLPWKIYKSENYLKECNSLIANGKDETLANFYLLSRLDLKFKYSTFGQVLSNSLFIIRVAHIFQEFFTC